VGSRNVQNTLVTVKIIGGYVLNISLGSVNDCNLFHDTQSNVVMPISFLPCLSNKGELTQLQKLQLVGSPLIAQCAFFPQLLKDLNLFPEVHEVIQFDLNSFNETSAPGVSAGQLCRL